MASKMKKGSSLPTSKDVAQYAGVSQSTVSYVITGSKKISDATRKKVEEAMQVLGYHPHSGARALRTAKTRMLVLMVHLAEGSDAFETVPYINAITQEAQKFGYEVVLSTGAPSASALEELSRRGICDGFILMDISRNDERIPLAESMHLPVVLMGRPERSVDLDIVDVDARYAADQIIRDLVATGHRSVAVLGGSEHEVEDHLFVAEFFEGLTDSAAAHGLELQVFRPRNDSWQAMEATLPQILADQHERLAVVTRTPRSCSQAYSLLEAAGLSVGEDVSLVGYCSNHAACEYPRPLSNVSTIAITQSKMAVQTLISRLENPQVPCVTTLLKAPPFHRRETTVDWNLRG
ncbi:hypothetical protein BSR29_02085 [Boudabousia liubingyangii]|uniref:Uncharacterized protein n=1 Tax=Boudabousia liubingyangii TaxID=1921764 RepID=A0A1Q5PQT1_9ACTO|nr:LacI family DNA-binding transcriptional regulator [Boudabousia liubingyangii]OKL48204.1 hypothetical protein BSR28_00365 [Boudabousia liubingyangii]OKL49760.1 hypothetical protein BSR29_02085 [Boudabousia liubingyangii]